MRPFWTTAASVALLLAPAAAQEGVQRPKFNFVRTNEDWSVLRSLRNADGWSEEASFFDRWKYVPLNESGSIWVSFGLRTQSRYENWSNFGFNAANDDDFVLTRVRGHADIHFGEKYRVFTELKTVQATDRDLPGGRRGIDLDTFDFAQAFAEVSDQLSSDTSVSIRAGRQMFSFGKQRLISPLPWANTLRAWDGLSAELRFPDWTVTALGTAFVPVDKTDFNEADADQLVVGVYATRKPTPERSGLDVYVLGNTRDTSNVNRNDRRRPSRHVRRSELGQDRRPGGLGRRGRPTGW